MEKRHFTRILFQTEALMEHHGRSFRGGVENLSLKGMMLKTADKVPVDEVVAIKIFLSGSSSELAIDVMGKVVRHEPEGLAIVFEKIDLDSFIHLKNVVAYNTGDDTEVMEEFYSHMRTPKEPC